MLNWCLNRICMPINAKEILIKYSQKHLTQRNINVQETHYTTTNTQPTQIRNCTFSNSNENRITYGAHLAPMYNGTNMQIINR